MEQSILSYNTDHSGPSECYGAIASAAYNLINEYESNMCVFTFDPPVGNILNVDPLLGPLQDNGGLTQTHALKFSSPAIDSASTSCYSAWDQRGVARPFDADGDGTAECDMGAYEAKQFFFMPLIAKPAMD